ncbi:MAG TPA: steroid 3-ketoacyl-CoA thiolase [Acidimicrobiales bacterium]|jgi:acetyl-CoA C-acetyltransferase|nr:steroid 3-ketoacyl-CoA thiolase [Acidimicrobiales bacterium]
MSELSGNEVVIVEAVRSPIGRRGGGMSTFHSADALSTVQKELIDRSGVDPAEVGQVVGGCVSQVGMQGFNITRTAWLTAGLPISVAATTVDSQCGSSQQATNMATSLVASGVVDVAVACGVELMSRVPMGSSLGEGVGKAVPKTYFSRYEWTSQFEGAERIADKWGITREETDRLGVESQQRAARAWAEGRFDTQIVPMDAPDLGEDGKPTGTTHRVERDEGLRETTLEAIKDLKPVARPDGVHTAASSSQISDAAAAVLLMTRAKADALGLKPRARVVDTCLVGTDPVLMLTGPIDATHRLLERTGMSMDDMDLTEINEAFASVVLAWERELSPDHEKVNPNGGAIALGHALGSTGAVLVTKALHELERIDGTNALVTMCCGGGLGTGTILQRI